jgi:hypothetical protein
MIIYFEHDYYELQVIESSYGAGFCKKCDIHNVRWKRRGCPKDITGAMICIKNMSSLWKIYKPIKVLLTELKW